jgi:photosystem II stability/assembly factor-like uncharacterized protein
MRCSSKIALLGLTWWLLLAAPPAEAQWKALGLSARQVNKLRAHDGFLYACTTDGLHRLSLADPDTIWTPLGFAGQDVLDLAALGPLTFLAAKELTGAPGDTVSLFRSTDGGASWQPFQNGFGAGGGSSGRQARLLLASAGSPGTVFATSGRIEKSIDAGVSWRVVGQGQIINAIAQSPAHPQVLWAGGETVILAPYALKSSDGGDSWRQISLFAGGDNAVDAIAAHPTDSSVVYLGMEGRVMKSEDGGTTWWTMTSPGPTLYTFGMAIRPFLPLKIYTAGASFDPDPRGVVFHQSLDGGLSWRAISYPAYAGLGAYHLLLEIDGIQETLYVATGNGVYRHTEIPVGVLESGDAPPAALRCQPNPFSRETSFGFALPKTGEVSLQIVDVQGRLVSTLASGPLRAGPHDVRWDAQQVATGLYFCKLRFGGKVQTLKILCLR